MTNPGVLAFGGRGLAEKSLLERSGGRPAGPGQDGLAELALSPRHGRTRLTHLRTRPPLAVQRALYPDEALPGMAYIYLADPTAGLLGNDRRRVSVAAGPGAEAHITTQSAAKVFTMPDGKASLAVELTAEEGAWLEYRPDPVIPFAGAELEAETAITVSPGAVVLFSEVLAPGRTAMGEVFRYRRLANRLTVRDPQGRLLYREAFELSPAVRSPFNPAVLGRPARPCTLASVLVLTDRRPAPRLTEAVRAALPRAGGVSAAASALPNGSGAAVKVIADDDPLAQSAVDACWAAVRSLLLGAPPPTPRKY